ncbi:hypothetical protein AGMMS49546_27080 [Spirochaetia bacterium]|nr:hypothetical protein AGMMS49546_27080 [Spirochaetia bacterium]
MYIIKKIIKILKIIRSLDSETVVDIENIKININQQKNELIKIKKKNKILNKEKINVVFVCHEPQSWGSLKTVFETCYNDSDFNVTIVQIPVKRLVKGRKESFEKYEDVGAEYFFKGFPCTIINGFDHKTNKWFDLRELEPDYLFFHIPYNSIRPPQYHSRIISGYTTLCFVHYAIGFSDVFKDTCPADFFNSIDILFCESEYNKKLYIELDVLKPDVKLFLTGFPRFDNLNQYKNAESSIWKFCSNEKKFRIIWTPRWSITEGTSHFIEFKDKILDFADKHSEMEFIFRPHPYAFYDLTQRGIMRNKDIELYKNEYFKRENAHIDSEKEYLKQFYSSDVLITDISTIIAEYFLTGKPIIYCHKKDCFNEFSRRLSEGFYWAHSWNEVVNYLHMLQCGNDPLREKRMEIINSAYYIPDMGSGNKIKNILKEDFYKNG